MRRRRVHIWISLLIAALLIASGFLVGRATAPDTSPSGKTKHMYKGRIGDVFRVPAAAVRCTVRQEKARPPGLYCVHTPRATHVVYFSRNELDVWRVGFNDHPVFSSSPT
jgi:hypothetical protein